MAVTKYYDEASGSWKPVSASGATESFFFVGPVDPVLQVPAGKEYVWFKTDGNGTTLDIITGIGQ